MRLYYGDQLVNAVQEKFAIFTVRIKNATGGQNGWYFNATPVCRYIYLPLCFKGLNSVSCINQLVGLCSSRGARHSEYTRIANGIEFGLMTVTYWGSTAMKAGIYILQAPRILLMTPSSTLV
jgi:hypothetical protein